MLPSMQIQRRGTVQVQVVTKKPPFLSDETKTELIPQTQNQTRKETKSNPMSDSNSKSKSKNEIVLSSTDLEGAIANLVAKAKSKSKSITKSNTKSITKSNTITKTANTSKRRRSDSITAETQNSLTEILPGYVAPMSLDSSSLDAYKYPNANQRIPSQISNNNNNHNNNNNDHSNQQTPKNFKLATMDPVQKQIRQNNADAGSSWFHFQSTPNTQSLQADIAIIRNRNYIDPKKFYKSSDFGKKNKYNKNAKNLMVQLGTVVEGSMESVSTQRLSKKQRKNTFLEEVMGDVFEEKTDYVKKKFHKMQYEKITAASKLRKRSKRIMSKSKSKSKSKRHNR